MRVSRGRHGRWQLTSVDVDRRFPCGRGSAVNLLNCHLFASGNTIACAVSWTSWISCTEGGGPKTPGWTNSFDRGPKGSALHWPPRNGRGPQMLCSTHAHRHAYFTYISFMFVLFLYSYYVRAVSATNVIWVDAFFFWTQRIQKLRYMVQALESWDHWNIWIPCPARPNYQHNLLRHRHLPSGDGQARAKRLRPDSRRCWGRSDQLCDPWTKKGCTKDPLSGTVRKEQRLRTLKSRLWWKEWIESLTFAPDELKTVYIHACHILQEIYVYI